MGNTLQPVLDSGKARASDLSVFYSPEARSYDVYIGLALLERVGADPEDVQHKMLVGRLYNAGVALRELRDNFNHDARTVKKWAAALLSGDIEQMARAFAGRGGKGKITPELVRFAKQHYRDRARYGRNYREVIISKIEEVFHVRISSTAASELFRSEKEDAVPSQPTAENVANGEHDEPASASKPAASVKRSPTPLPVQELDSANGSEELVHHAGQAIFAAEMQDFGNNLQRQLIGQILQGAVNVEQSKTICAESLANFTGAMVTGLKDQRDGIDGQADTESVLDVYQRNAELLADGPNRGDVFYFDPHTKEYTGQLAVLKGWCGKRHAVSKVMNLDTFHTSSGRPCFVQHYSAYYDLRERFFISRQLFDRLFTQDKRRNRTFVIDRAIYGLAALQSFGEDHVITWEKNYNGGGWDDTRAAVTFTRSRAKNHSGDLHPITFRCQQSPWRRDTSFRRIIVRASRPGAGDIQVSILTSHPAMDIRDVVWAMFRRWVQENDFKYLDTHFGFNQLTSRDSHTFREQAGQFRDRPVDSPEYRELKDAVHRLEATLGKRFVQAHKCEKRTRELETERNRLAPRRAALVRHLHKALAGLNSDTVSTRNTDTLKEQAEELTTRLKKIRCELKKKAAKEAQLRTEIAGLETRLDALEPRLCEAVRKQSRLQLLIDGAYCFLDTRCKTLMDALRITASNMFRNVQEQFRAICDNFRDDHVMVRTLSRCSGTMARTAEEVIFTLWLPGSLQPHRLRAFQRLLADIEEQINNSMGGQYKRVRLKLVTGPVRL